MQSKAVSAEIQRTCGRPFHMLALAGSGNAILHVGRLDSTSCAAHMRMETASVLAVLRQSLENAHALCAQQPEAVAAPCAAHLDAWVENNLPFAMFFAACAVATRSIVPGAKVGACVVNDKSPLSPELLKIATANLANVFRREGYYITDPEPNSVATTIGTLIAKGDAISDVKSRLHSVGFACTDLNDEDKAIARNWTEHNVENMSEICVASFGEYGWRLEPEAWNLMDPWLSGVTVNVLFSRTNDGGMVSETVHYISAIGL